MKPNRMQQRLAEGKVPIGHMIMEFGTRGIARLVEVAGVDFVIVDMEHSGFTAADVADLMAWFRATTVTPFVRVPQIQYHLIARTLDAGALGVMAPNVRDAEQARAVVAAAKYAPLGQRGVALGGANTDYERVDPKEFLALANRNTSVILQVESQAGLENLDAIASTPGVDVLWVGHFDLSNAMGIPGEFDHPDFQAALRSVVRAARGHGLAAGIQPRSLEQAREWLDLGFNVISFGSDFAVYLNGLREGVVGLRRATERGTSSPK